MRRVSSEEITGEISAKAYKKLVSRLKGYNKKKMWEILDHYLFHQITDKHVIELIRILDKMEGVETDLAELSGEPPQDKVPAVIMPKMTPPEVQLAAETTAVFSLPVEETRPVRQGKFSYAAPLTIEDMDANKDRLDIMYDMTYFTYLAPDVVPINARALVTYAGNKDLPVMPHWDLLAHSQEFLTAEDEEDEEI